MGNRERQCGWNEEMNKALKDRWLKLFSSIYVGQNDMYTLCEFLSTLYEHGICDAAVDKKCFTLKQEKKYIVILLH